MGNKYDQNNYPDANYDSMLNYIASMCHEANKAYCESIGDTSQPDWEDAPQWQKDSAVDGVAFHINNPKASAGASHQNWYDQKLADGWSYGPVKDPENKRHPCMVPFAELPIEQQIKDHIFRNTVHGVLAIVYVDFIAT